MDDATLVLLVVVTIASVVKRSLNGRALLLLGPVSMPLAASQGLSQR